MNARLRVLSAFTVAALSAGCATVYNPATQRTETLISTPIEVSIGNTARMQMGLTSLTKGAVSPAELARVQQIGNRIAAVSDRKDVKYQFGVVKDGNINAFALPGGTIYVHTGTLDRATDDELAAVIAHEVGHVAARHAAKHLQSDLGFAVLINLAGAASGSQAAMQIGSSMYRLFRNGYSRKDELEADRIGMGYADKAGFDPWGMVSFFEKMLAEEKDSGARRATAWMSTHPLTSDRIAEATRFLETLGGGQKFCPECGRRYSKRMEFCPKDGNALKEPPRAGAGS